MFELWRRQSGLFEFAGDWDKGDPNRIWPACCNQTLREGGVLMPGTACNDDSDWQGGIHGQRGS